MVRKDGNVINYLERYFTVDERYRGGGGGGQVDTKTFNNRKAAGSYRKQWSIRKQKVGSKRVKRRKDHNNNDNDSGYTDYEDDSGGAGSASVVVVVNTKHHSRKSGSSSLRSKMAELGMSFFHFFIFSFFSPLCHGYLI